MSMHNTGGLELAYLNEQPSLMLINSTCAFTALTNLNVCHGKGLKVDIQFYSLEVNFEDVIIFFILTACILCVTSC